MTDSSFLPLLQVEAAVCDVESKLMQALLDDCGGAIRRDGVPKVCHVCRNVLVCNTKSSPTALN